MVFTWISKYDLRLHAQVLLRMLRGWRLLLDFIAYSFHPRVRGYRPERLSPIRHEQAHLSEELGVLQSPYVLGLDQERNNRKSFKQLAYRARTHTHCTVCRGKLHYLRFLCAKRTVIHGILASV